MILAFFAAKGDCSLPLRRFAVGTAMACGAVMAAFGVLVAWQPAWYRDWVGSLLFLVILLSFHAELNYLIWSKFPPMSSEKRRLALGFAVYIAMITAGLYVASMVVTDWYNLLFLAPFAVLLALGCVYHSRALRRIDNQGAGTMSRSLE